MGTIKIYNRVTTKEYSSLNFFFKKKFESRKSKHNSNSIANKSIKQIQQARIKLII